MTSFFLDVKCSYPAQLKMVEGGLIWEMKYEASEEAAKRLKLHRTGMLTVNISEFAFSRNSWTMEGKILNLEKVWCDCKGYGPASSPFIVVIEILAPASAQLAG